MKSSSRDALCCCEYINHTGDRSHIAACCCDCYALDSLCDRLLTCKSVPDKQIGDMLATIEDRCRLPGFGGQGATRVKLDVAVPILFIPACLVIATLGPTMTVIMLVALPASLLLFYRIWARREKKIRTQMFYMWGLVSVLQMYLTFEVAVVGFRKVLLWENLLLTTIMGLMLYALYLAKKGPGIIRPETEDAKAARLKDFQNMQREQFNIQKQQAQMMSETSGYSSSHQSSNHSAGGCGHGNTKHSHLGGIDTQGLGDSSKQHSCCAADAHQKPELTPLQAAAANTMNAPEYRAELGFMGNMLVQNFGFSPDEFEKNLEDLLEMEQGAVIPLEEVHWVDSRLTSEGFLVTWCEHCKLVKPPRSGHCPVCTVCVHNRDHHCVWIDCCIGAENHCAFFYALLLFIIGGSYGVHLTLTSVCTPEMYWDWFLLPNDCRFSYSDFPTALCWVSAWYSVTAVGGMCTVLLQQVILISQNLTSQELHTAHIAGLSKLICGAVDNSNNQGLIKNWINFLKGNRQREHVYITSHV